MNGRLLFLLPLLCIFNVAIAAAAGAAPERSPFYLIPVLSPDGKTTQTGACIGALITNKHIIAPASCMKINKSNPSGVFIDFRPPGNKTYPENTDLFPISEFTFSKNIVIKDKFALITLHVPFTDGNTMGIEPVFIDSTGKVVRTFSYERKKQNVDLGTDGKGKPNASYGEDNATLISFDDAKFDKEGVCEWINSIVKDFSKVALLFHFVKMRFFIILAFLFVVTVEAVYNPELEYPQPASPLASKMADEAVKESGANPFGDPEPTVKVPIQRFKRLTLIGQKTPPTDNVILMEPNPDKIKDDISATFSRST
uniref:Peptidase S1 domain-containing protein n=1 Tax=Panagrolaimus sp. PS1159 TaxID=55785 RepID=A0AC35FIY1_9BILA